MRWAPVLARAATIVEAEPVGMTLRGLFYRLVSEGLLRNTQGHYSTLSRSSARARREGRFPPLIDRGRRLLRPLAFDGPDAAHEWLVGCYRRNRAAGQPWAIYLGVEKNALAGVLESWFAELGLPVLPLGGYGSQTFVDDVVADVADAIGERDERRSVLIYGGDFDASGEDISRDFLERTRGWFDRFERVALTREQVESYRLPPQVGKADDPRAADFMARHGRLVQVELDALPLATLQELYQDVIERYFDVTKYERALALELRDLAELERRWR